MVDLVQLLRAYIHTALSAAPGYKALVVDRETMRMCSMLMGRSELADRDVVHVEQLDRATSSKRKSHQELKVGLNCTMAAVARTEWLQSRMHPCAGHPLWPHALCHMQCATFTSLQSEQAGSPVVFHSKTTLKTSLLLALLLRAPEYTDMLWQCPRPTSFVSALLRFLYHLLPCTWPPVLLRDARVSCLPLVCAPSRPS